MRKTQHHRRIDTRHGHKALAWLDEAAQSCLPLKHLVQAWLDAEPAENCICGKETEMRTCGLGCCASCGRAWPRILSISDAYQPR